LWFHREQDVFLTGDEKAASLGVNITTARQLILGLASLLAVITVAFCGVIAFVGLIAPHIARRFVGALNRRLLPVSALCGAVILLAADLASRTIAPPSEIPLTIITSLIGAPFFIYILVRTPEVAV
jgi:iron complex transport system permease protein